ncbi:phosphatidate cytidylyltransferase [Noviherbaspirillum denitrificans]|uniref:Phosphatidate cytidylyltransferase n=1 Tax=Noviherbaspirillum denitrificans TaxID=1968433 RepID=A0A254TIZ8_9BURK|nr:phosphatidate cytidylyltransferase [Noviherbaspirillum denitrificans]OWW22187.1 CDP-diglyceride synthetase [Noviherbaspirillum denitrificans]
MLRTRVITALVLLAVLLSVLYSKSQAFFLAVTAVFFGAAAWESARLFRASQPVVAAVIWTAVFLVFVYLADATLARFLFTLCVAIWAIRLAPSLGLGLPVIGSAGSRLLNIVYGITLLGCFAAIIALFQHSPLYLLSAMAIVWIADIGAYFAGKAFGKRKLAPSISPGKSWEGAIGGWIAVVALATASAHYPPLAETFAARVLAGLGWVGFAVVMTLMVAASIVGDLFESQLKRRAEMKDSSNLLPGHGGVLDRIDALIPTLPLAVLIGTWI